MGHILYLPVEDRQGVRQAQLPARGRASACAAFGAAGRPLDSLHAGFWDGAPWERAWCGAWIPVSCMVMTAWGARVKEPRNLGLIVRLRLVPGLLYPTEQGTPRLPPSHVQ